MSARVTYWIRRVRRFGSSPRGRGHGAGLERWIPPHVGRPPGHDRGGPLHSGPAGFPRASPAAAPSCLAADA
jgi:hypothetical protein